MADIATVRYMGFDPRRIKYLGYLIDKEGIDLERDVDVVKDGTKLDRFFSSSCLYKDFNVLDRWKEIKVSQKEGRP